MGWGHSTYSLRLIMQQISANPQIHNVDCVAELRCHPLRIIFPDWIHGRPPPDTTYVCVVDWRASTPLVLARHRLGGGDEEARRRRALPGGKNKWLIRAIK